MSSGDFGMDLRQSVQAHLETIQAMAAEAKLQIAEGIAAVRPAAVPPAPAFVPPPAAPAAPRFTVSFDDAYEPPPAGPFDDDPAFVTASKGERKGPAVSFDDLGSDGIPVWEDPG